MMAAAQTRRGEKGRTDGWTDGLRKRQLGLFLYRTLLFTSSSFLLQHYLPPRSLPRRQLLLPCLFFPTLRPHRPTYSPPSSSLYSSSWHLPCEPFVPQTPLTLLILTPLYPSSSSPHSFSLTFSSQALLFIPSSKHASCVECPKALC